MLAVNARAGQSKSGDVLCNFAYFFSAGMYGLNPPERRTDPSSGSLWVVEWLIEGKRAEVSPDGSGKRFPSDDTTASLPPFHKKKKQFEYNTVIKSISLFCLSDLIVMIRLFQDSCQDWRYFHSLISMIDICHQSVSFIAKVFWIMAFINGEKPLFWHC